MRQSEKPDFKLFWTMIIVGLLSTGFGLALVWLVYAASHEVTVRKSWVTGEALLQEVGIGYSSGIKNASYYYMIARYTLHLDGRNYQGTTIGEGYSHNSAAEVMSLIVPFAPEAAKFNPGDMSILNSQHTWFVAYLPVPVRYDPQNPANSEMIINNPVETKVIGNWFIYPFIFLILLGGGSMLIFAWPAARGEKRKIENKAAYGPALFNYPPADRHRLLDGIHLLQAEISRQITVRDRNEPTDLGLFARQIEEMADEVRNLKLVPNYYVHNGMGRYADEIFGDGKLSHYAYELDEIINDLAKHPPVSHGHNS